MNFKNKLLDIAVKAKRIYMRLGASIVKIYPDFFRGEKLDISTEEANKYLNYKYPDVGSTSWCNNNITPIYDLHIIIPAYNVERYIEKCVNSILSQKTNYSFLITIVNDGSTDDTGKIIEKYNILPNIEIINQQNKGYSGARNIALQEIKGRYLMFVDSDDYLEVGAIDTMLQLAISADADIVQGSFYNVDNSGVFSKVILKNERSNTPGGTEILSYPWAKIFRSDLFRHLSFPPGYWYEDSITKFILVPNSNLKISTSHAVYNYRHHEGTVMKQNKNNLKTLDALYVTRALLKDCLEHYKIDRYLLNHFLHQARWNFNRIEVLKDDKIKKCVFIVHKNLYDTYFKNLRLWSERFPVMQKAFEEGDYHIYRIACMFYT